MRCTCVTRELERLAIAHLDQLERLRAQFRLTHNAQQRLERDLQHDHAHGALLAGRRHRHRQLRVPLLGIERVHLGSGRLAGGRNSPHLQRSEAKPVLIAQGAVAGTGGDQVDPLQAGQNPLQPLLLGGERLGGTGLEQLSDVGRACHAGRAVEVEGDRLPHPFHLLLGEQFRPCLDGGLFLCLLEKEDGGRGNRQHQYRQSGAAQDELGDGPVSARFGGRLLWFVLFSLEHPLLPPAPGTLWVPVRPKNDPQCLPEWPKPPSPRSLSSKLSTISKLAFTTGSITSWAIRSPTSMRKDLSPRFQQETKSCPW